MCKARTSALRYVHNLADDAQRHQSDLVTRSDSPWSSTSDAMCSACASVMAALLSAGELSNGAGCSSFFAVARSALSLTHGTHSRVCLLPNRNPLCNGPARCCDASTGRMLDLWLMTVEARAGSCTSANGDWRAGENYQWTRLCTDRCRVLQSATLTIRDGRFWLSSVQNTRGLRTASAYSDMTGSGSLTIWWCAHAAT